MKVEKDSATTAASAAAVSWCTGFSGQYIKKHCGLKMCVHVCIWMEMQERIEEGERKAI